MGKMLYEPVIDSEVATKTNTLSDQCGNEGQVKFFQSILLIYVFSHSNRPKTFFFGEGHFESGVIERGLYLLMCTTMRALGSPVTKPARKEYLQWRSPCSSA